MSYEGYSEYICEKGHYLSYDAYEDSPESCPICKFKMKYTHSVDQTNGYGENEKYIDEYLDDDGNPYTGEKRESVIYSDQEAPKKVIKVEDIEHVDKYGNKYYTERVLYTPDSSVWKSLS